MTINILIGETLPAEDGHTHQYSLRCSGRGQLKGGLTSTVNGHYHIIENLFETEKGKSSKIEETLEHNHQFDFMTCDFLNQLQDSRHDYLVKKGEKEEVSEEM